MTRDDVVELIRQRVGFNRRMSDTQIFQNMDYVQLLYELGHDNNPLPWFTFQSTATVDTVADTQTVDLPEGFVQFDDAWPLLITSAEGVVYPLQRTPAYDVVALQNEGSQLPKYFEVDAARLLLYPAPDKVYSITIPHYNRLAKLSETTDSPWFTHFPLLLVEETVNSIMRSTRDIEGLKMSNVNSFRADYVRRVEGRKHELKNYDSA
jgi:hypothetical protein